MQSLNFVIKIPGRKQFHLVIAVFSGKRRCKKIQKEEKKRSYQVYKFCLTLKKFQAISFLHFFFFHIVISSLPLTENWRNSIQKHQIVINRKALEKCVSGWIKKKKKIRAFFEVSPRVCDGQIETNAVKKMIKQQNKKIKKQVKGSVAHNQRWRSKYNCQMR